MSLKLITGKNYVPSIPKEVKPPETKDTKKEKKEEKKIIVYPSGTLDQIMTAIVKEKGPTVVVPGNSIPLIRRLRTGIFEFDFYTGGGFPCGRYSIVYGPESSNKTNLALKAVAEAQQWPEPNNKAIWMNVEQTFDPVWATKMGVDVSKLLVVNAGYGEEAIDLMDALVRASDVAVLVLDSLAALVPSKEIAQSIENFDIGIAALLIKRAVNKLMYAFGSEIKKGHDPCVILINQTRFKPGVLFGDPEVMPGGEAQKFLCSLRVRVSAKNIMDPLTSKVLFKEVHAIIKKSKVLVRANDFNFKMCMLDTGPVGIGKTDSFPLVKDILQSLGLMEKVTKGWSVTGVEMACGACKGKGCTACGSKGSLKRVWSTLSAMQEEYLHSSEFSRRLQTICINSYQGGMLVDDPDTFSPKEIEPGIPVPIKL